MLKCKLSKPVNVRKLEKYKCLIILNTKAMKAYTILKFNMFLPTKIFLES